MKRLALIGVTLLGFVSGAGATSMTALDLKALLARADRVVLATVVSAESHWTPSHDAIYTDSVVRVERSYKGKVKSGQTIVVRREGGSVGGIGMRVYGSPSLSPGEEAVVFLEERGGASWVVGMAQGKWQVSTQNGQKVVHADLSGIAFVEAGRPALAGPRPLVEIEREIRALVTRGVK
jgi:hypothetical protein